MSRRSGVARGNGTSTAYVYDPVSRLDTLTHNGIGAKLGILKKGATAPRKISVRRT